MAKKLPKGGKALVKTFVREYKAGSPYFRDVLQDKLADFADSRGQFHWDERFSEMRRTLIRLSQDQGYRVDPYDSSYASYTGTLSSPSITGKFDYSLLRIFIEKSLMQLEYDYTVSSVVEVVIDQHWDELEELKKVIDLNDYKERLWQLFERMVLSIERNMVYEGKVIATLSVIEALKKADWIDMANDHNYEVPTLHIKATDTCINKFQKELESINKAS